MMAFGNLRPEFLELQGMRQKQTHHLLSLKMPQTPERTRTLPEPVGPNLKPGVAGTDKERNRMP